MITKKTTIHSRESYREFLSEDRKALHIATGTSRLRDYDPYHIDMEIWKFQKQLRKCEYLYNSDKSSPFLSLKKFLAAWYFKKLSCRLGFTINPNCFGPGLRIAHRGTIVVHGGAKIGSNCTINACVNIGAPPGFDDEVPIIGDNVYIGPGAKIYGKIYIANGCIIGANAVVNKDCYEENTLLVGIPASPRKRKQK